MQLASAASHLEAKIQAQDELIGQLTHTQGQLEQGLAAARAEYDRRCLELENGHAHEKHTIEELTLLVAEKQSTIDSLGSQRRDDKALTDLSHLLAEKQQELDAARRAVADAEKDKRRLVEYDRFLAARQAEWDAHMARLKDELGAAKAEVAALQAREPSPDLALLKQQYVAQQEYIANLEKHAVLAKTKAKQTQQQLQQLIRDSSNQSDGRPSDEARRIQQLEDMNEALMRENAAMKVVLNLVVHLCRCSVHWYGVWCRCTCTRCGATTMSPTFAFGFL